MSQTSPPPAPDTPRSPALTADRLSFSYNGTAVLQEVSLRVPAGELVAVLGPNGSGKTTLLRLLAGLLVPQAGRVTVEGTPLTSFSRTALARRMAMVPQETHLAFDYTVLEIALMGRYPHLSVLELEGPADLRIAREALAATGTAHLETRGFMTLSGGEKQRVVIASALAQLWQPEGADAVNGTGGVLLLDEPTASLDLGYQLEVAATLRALNETRGTTMLVSTHDLNLAATLCRQLVLLREGQVIAAGPTDTVLTRANVRALYDVEADVERHADTGHLTVVPVRRV